MSQPNEHTSPGAQELLERVKSQSGPAYWRSLDQLAATPEFQERLRKDFSAQQEQWIDPVTRRNFLKLMGASLALSGLTACGVRKPNEAIVPYVNQPEELVLGRPQFYATAMPYAGFGYPLLVESHEGRPIKVEGNPDHPASLGAAMAWNQASVLGMYDPDRSQVLTKFSQIRSWSDFVAELHAAVEADRAAGGGGVRILTSTITSPTLAAQLKKLREQLPNAKVVQYDPAHAHSARTAAQLSLGEAADVQYRFEAADVVLSLDSDFMMDGPGAIYYAKQFADKRRVRGPKDRMNRFYAVESSPMPTGTLADHRLPVRATEVLDVARAVAKALNVPNAAPAGAPEYTANAKWIAAAVRDLQANAGRSIVVAGDHQPAAVHAVAYAINNALGNIGKTVLFTEPVEADPQDQIAELKQLVEDMKSDAVKVLVILGGNPVYDVPADLGFLDALYDLPKKKGEPGLPKIPFTAHLSEYFDETSAHVMWHVPKAHYLEAWGDIRAFNGLVSIIQPLIAPLYPSVKTAYDVVGAMLGEATVSSFELVRAYWQAQRTGGDFEQFWRRILHDGYIPGTQVPVKNVTPKAEALASLPEPFAERSGLDITFRLDPSVRDGSFANLAWLQELPKPFTKITWDNVVLVSPATAAKLGVKAAPADQFEAVEVVELTYRGRKITGPIFRVAGHADDTVTVHLGYGRTRAGKVGGSPDAAIGFSAYELQTTDALGVGTGAEVKRTGGSYNLAQTQLHFTIDDPDIKGMWGLGKQWAEANSSQLNNRGIVRYASLDEFQKHPDFVKHQGPHMPDDEKFQHMNMYDGAWEYRGYAWGMAIDMNVCHGCNACVLACQAENNIPVVGKEQVLLQREMHWLRIDQYYVGDASNPMVFNQPLPCMHCETAPCEVVCPVVATVHSDEGINDMVYNRCVGTRFCSNNCPYKVRRFNWFQYAEWNDPLKKMLNNPDVTVRSRGVMEKCTYCIQRIAYARIEAETDGRKIRDGEVQTACQATCPTDAIIFGNINDPTARVTQLKATSLNYSLLADLNTRPRTTYLAVVKNTNPELEA